MSRRPAPPRLVPNAVLIVGVTSTAFDRRGSFRVQPPPPVIFPTVGKPENGRGFRERKVEEEEEETGGGHGELGRSR